jgi:arylsulfatase A-like enzyme
MAMRILFLDLDTLRPDHLGCYGYHRNTSPNLDRLAARGTRFDEYYVSDAPCLPARAALVTGTHGIRNGAVNHGGTCADLRIQGASRGFRSDTAQVSLWNVFRRAGLHTCSISPFAERHSSFWFLAGLNEMHNHSGKGGMESAEEVTPVVLDWLDANRRRDHWMLHVNYWDPHTPYRAPEGFGNPFKDDPLPAWLDAETLARHTALAGPHTARDNGMYTGADNPRFPRQPNDIRDMTQLRRCLDGYDCGIRYMDGHIGQILDRLEAQGLLEETAVIVTADHGENFGELGMYSEHGTADRATCRIPMLVSWPGLPAGRAARGLRYHFDLLPTLADLLGADMGPARAEWDGISYADVLRGGPDAGRDDLVLSQCAHVCQRSVRWDRWLYLRTYHDGLHPHFEPDMLFDLVEDPHETRDLARARPDLVREGAARLLAWHDRMMRRQPAGQAADPLDLILAERGPEHASRPAAGRPAPYADYFRRLRETGRAAWIPRMLERHPWLAEWAGA